MTDPFGWDPMEDPLYSMSMGQTAPAAAPTPAATPLPMMAPQMARAPMATAPMAAPQTARAPIAAAPMAGPQMARAPMAAPTPATAAPMTPAMPVQAPPTGFLHTVVAGDTIWNIAQRFGVTVDDIVAANPGIVPENLLIGSVIRVPAPAVSYIRYTVKPGDSLWQIAQRYGVPWQELARINRIVDPLNLMVGSTLLIPAF